MAFRATIISPIGSSTFDRMPGVSATSNTSRLGYQSSYSTLPNTYSHKYERRNFGGSNSSYGSSRALPIGRGPLDSSGNKLTHYSTAIHSYTRNDPIKPVHTDFSRSTFKKSYSPSTSVVRNYSTPSSLFGRRSASISNLSEISSRRVSERETTLSPNYHQQPHVSDTISKSILPRNLYLDRDVSDYSRTPRSIRASSYYTDKRDRFESANINLPEKSSRIVSERDLSDIPGRRVSERETTLSPNYRQHQHVSENISKSTLSPNLHSERDVTDYSVTPSRSSRASSHCTDKRDRFDTDKNESEITRQISNIRITRDHGTMSPTGYDSPSLARRNSEDASSDIQTKSVSRQSSNSSMSTVVKYANLGKVGLRNLGNTCFMNSILQCLSHTRPLLEYCLKEDYLLDKATSNGMKGSLVTAYANLMSSMWKDSSDTYISPNSFKTQIQRFAPRFMGYLQQDAQEFLRYLLEGLHEDVNKITQKPRPITVDDDQFKSDVEQSCEYWKNYLKFDNSKIVEVFVGQLKSVLKFRDCGHRSVTFDPFWDLSLPIPKGRSEVNLMDCINYFMKEESLDDRPTCTKCKERKSCTKGFSIQKFPKILVLHLKRFSQDRYSRKISTHVEYPVTNLDMSKFAAEDVMSQRAIYNLYAVSNHSGSTHSGHYTAYCKHPFLNDWNLFDDIRVSHVSSTQVTSSEGYVLFYELATQSSHL